MAAQSRWDVWKEVLIPYFSDDQCIIKLWCSTPMMKELIISLTSHMNCHVYPALAPSRCKSIFPSLISQCKDLRSVKLIGISSSDEEFHPLLFAKIIWMDLPTSLVKINIPYMNLLNMICVLSSAILGDQYLMKVPIGEFFTGRSQQQEPTYHPL
jgi:hypothetical protein